MQVIYGHRGASGYAPENTLEAFELAAKMGRLRRGTGRARLQGR